MSVHGRGVTWYTIICLQLSIFLVDLVVCFPLGQQTGLLMPYKAVPSFWRLLP